MKRRELILASAGVASVALPVASRGATTCLLPDVSGVSGTTVPTACGPSRTTYSTNFPLTENPISEGARWRNTGLDWTPVATSNGLAYSTQTRNAYDDSYAFLSGFGADQAAAVIHLARDYNPV
jgi:hypothetical protein